MTKVYLGLAVLLVFILLLSVVNNDNVLHIVNKKSDGILNANGILNDYNELNNPALTDNDAQDIYTNYPVFPAKSCDNNNIKYWSRPTNGKCSPATFCGSLYNVTPQKVESDVEPPVDGVVRVNYYASNTES